MRYAKKLDDGWKIVPVIGTGDVAEAQTALLASQGYKPVVDAERPENTPYLLWSASYEDDGDTVAESFWSSSTIIHLDRAKLLALFAESGMLEAAISYFGEDADAQDWWASKMTYVEGSPMAEKVMQALGLTLEQVHAIVEKCRA